MKPGVYYGPNDTCPQYRPDRKEVDNVKGSDGQCSTCDYQTCSYYGYQTSCAANQSATEKLTKDQASDGPCYKCENSKVTITIVLDATNTTVNFSSFSSDNKGYTVKLSLNGGGNDGITYPVTVTEGRTATYFSSTSEPGDCDVYADNCDNDLGNGRETVSAASNLSVIINDQTVLRNLTTENEYLDMRYFIGKTYDTDNYIIKFVKAQNCSDINIFYMNKEQAKQCKKKAVPLNVVGSDGQCYLCGITESCDGKESKIYYIAYPPYYLKGDVAYESGCKCSSPYLVKGISSNTDPLNPGGPININAISTPGGNSSSTEKIHLPTTLIGVSSNNPYSVKIDEFQCYGEEHCSAQVVKLDVFEKYAPDVAKKLKEDDDYLIDGGTFYDDFYYYTGRQFKPKSQSINTCDDYVVILGNGNPKACAQISSDYYNYHEACPKGLEKKKLPNVYDSTGAQCYTCENKKGWGIHYTHEVEDLDTRTYSCTITEDDGGVKADVPTRWKVSVYKKGTASEVEALDGKKYAYIDQHKGEVRYPAGEYNICFDYGRDVYIRPYYIHLATKDEDACDYSWDEDDGRWHPDYNNYDNINKGFCSDENIMTFGGITCMTATFEDNEEYYVQGDFEGNNIDGISEWECTPIATASH